MVPNVKSAALADGPIKADKHRALNVVPDLLQTLEQVPGQQHVLLAPLARIHYLLTLRRVRTVPPLPTPPLFNAPLVPIKQLKPVMLGITDCPVKTAARNVNLTRIRLKRVERHHVQIAQVGGIPE